MFTLFEGKCLIHLIYDFRTIERSKAPREQLLFYRNYRGITREDLAEQLSVPADVITNFEKGFCEIQYEDAVRLAEILKIDPELLLDDYTKFAAPGCGQRIKEIRTSHGYSQSKFAEIIGVARCTVSIWEIEYHGTRPNREHYKKIISLDNLSSGGESK